MNIAEHILRGQQRCGDLSATAQSVLLEIQGLQLLGTGRGPHSRTRINAEGRNPQRTHDPCGHRDHQVVFFRKKLKKNNSVAFYNNTFFRSKRYCHTILSLSLEDQQTESKTTRKILFTENALSSLGCRDPGYGCCAVWWPCHARPLGSWLIRVSIS